MLRSMTGFGRCFVERASLSQQWEIKSVNSKYCDIKWRLPAYARYLEPLLEKIVRGQAARGRIEISLTLRFAPESAPKPYFDVRQAACMLDELKKMAAERKETWQPDYNRFLDIPALWSEPELEDSDDLSDMLAEGLVLALEDWNEARESEGESLGRDLRNRVRQMMDWRNMLAEAAPAIREDRIFTLRERLASILAGSDFELDEDRFLQEIVILTDRLDASEELTRLGAHLNRLDALLASGEEVGRKLDFTLQECFREINTCGNKLQDADLSRLVVDFKNELEKCREQAQNLE